MANVPVRLETPGAGTVPRVRIGLDVLGALAPTFEPGTGRLTLRASGRAPALVAPGARERIARIPTLILPTGLWLIAEGTVIPVGSARGRDLLRAKRWTIDAKRGEIVAVFER
jgi:hypothetical protein